jgi:ribosomal protein S18
MARGEERQNDTKFDANIQIEHSESKHVTMLRLFVDEKKKKKAKRADASSMV